MSFRHTIKSITLAFSLCLVSSSFAEDIEIFANEKAPSEPNILFVLDQSGSMATPIGTSGETRASSLQTAFNQVLSNTDLKDLNIGLMGFSYSSNFPRVNESDWPASAGVYRYVAASAWPYPHGVAFPVSPIDAAATPIMLSNLLPAAMNDGNTIGYFSIDNDSLINPVDGQTVREYLPDVLSSWNVSGETPMLESLYEAALYFRGEEPSFGNAPPHENHSAHPSTYSGSIHAVVTEGPDGSYNTCDTPDCGQNCALTTVQSNCAAGVTSCGLGTNCSTVSQDWSYTCNLSSEAACLADNPDYSSCELISYDDCSSTCTGEKDYETGACLGETTSSCTAKSYYNCKIPTDITTCDHSKYRCERIKETVTTVTDAKYISPITDECQSNAIILLSDGQPLNSNQSVLSGARDNLKTLIGRTADCSDVAGQVIPNVPGNTLSDGRCGIELTSYLANEDQNADIDGVNTVKTYTVGFGVSDNAGAENYLRSLATNGGGKYYSATDSSALVAAFQGIIKDIDSSARSYAAPVYTVDPASLLSHSKDIYLPLFENSALPRWSGNLKKFKLNDSGQIVDKNGVEAVDEKGALKASAIDFWADTSGTVAADSNPITSGGAASQLDPSTRKVLTDDGGSALVALSTTTATKSLLGDASMSDAYQNELIQFIKGYESDGTTPRKHLGDILHSKPTVVSYSSQQVVFFGTNEGYLHAIDAADATSTGGGKEKFAFMPSALLKNIEGQVSNTELTGDLQRIYGVDGSMTVWINDKNKNGKVDPADGDTAYLYFGLRRGGSHMYALDVTNPDAPSLLWKISNTDTGFSKLGETWSKPVVAKLRYKPSSTAAAVTDDVLIFGGGYDNRLDEPDRAARTSLSDTKGNAIYIVNAKTKALIWSYEGLNLQHSVPGNIRVLDLDRNGSIDRLYFGDTGGNIWRVDLNADDVDDDASLFDVKNDAKVRLFASLGGSGSDYRKFFYEPDVSFFRSAGKYVILVSIGSGHRSLPLGTNIEDRFYVLYDENVLNIPETAPAPLTEADLAASSALMGGSFLPSFKGWYKPLVTGNGEKVLASPIIFLNKVMFTTFATTDAAVSTGDEDSCSALASNQTRTYVLDLMTAAATVDLDGDGVVSTKDESINISHGDILDTPQLVFNAPSNCTSEGCNQHVDIRVGKRLVPIIDKDTVNGNVDLGDFLPKVYWLND